MLFIRDPVVRYEFAAQQVIHYDTSKHIKFTSSNINNIRLFILRPGSIPGVRKDCVVLINYTSELKPPA